MHPLPFGESAVGTFEEVNFPSGFAGWIPKLSSARFSSEAERASAVGEAKGLK
jgi:hypothetical protein